MIRIAIVDDEEIMRDAVYERIEPWVNDDVEITKYPSGEMFLAEIDKGQKFDILLTDIQMKEVSGIDLGRIIHKSQPQIYIIFITSYTEYAVESYTIEAYQYILKQDLEYRLPIVVKQLIDRITRDSKQYRMIPTDTGKDKVYYKDIIYIYKSKAGKYVYFVTMNKEYRERTTLQQVYQELGSKLFLMVERGYIVNMKHISKVSGDTIYMENDQWVKISRAKLADVKKEINCYWGE